LIAIIPLKEIVAELFLNSRIILFFMIDVTDNVGGNGFKVMAEAVEGDADHPEALARYWYFRNAYGLELELGSIISARLVWDSRFRIRSTKGFGSVSPDPHARRRDAEGRGIIGYL